MMLDPAPVPAGNATMHAWDCVPYNGTMPMTAKLRPAEARRALKMLGLKNAFFALTMLFRG